MCLADKFPESLPAFQKMFPNDKACAKYLEAIRWRDGFVCPRCASTAEPMRLGRPQLLRCKSCKRDISLLAGTVMERTHMPLSEAEAPDDDIDCGPVCQIPAKLDDTGGGEP